MQSKRIESITISYQNEAKFGEKLKIFRGECEGLYYFRTACESGKINTEAEIKLVDI
jgi:hypothetical protein